MKTLNILSGGAAQGLVAALAPELKTRTGFEIAGEFGAVGAMADKLREGMPADIVILTAALIAKLADETLVVPSSIADVGIVETAIAVRAGDPKPPAGDAASLRAVLLEADAIFVPDIKASTAGIHVARVLERLGITDAVADRLKIYPNGANRDAASRDIRCGAADRLHAIDRDHCDKGHRIIRPAAAGMRAQDNVHGRHHHPCRQRRDGADADRTADRR